MPRAKTIVKDPYGDTSKQRSREMIWKSFARLKHAPLSKVLLLPGMERYEIDTALAQGFRIENMIFVEKNPAILAHFTRRHYPGAIHYGKPLPPKDNILRMFLSQAAEVVKLREKKIDVCHLDFCSHCEAAEMLAELRQFVRSGVLAEGAALAITFLAGREFHSDNLGDMGLGFEVSNFDTNGQRSNAVSGFSDTDKGRIRHIWDTIGFHVQVKQVGKYQNARTKNPMIWLVTTVNEAPDNGNHDKGHFKNLFR